MYWKGNDAAKDLYVYRGAYILAKVRPYQGGFRASLLRKGERADGLGTYIPLEGTYVTQEEAMEVAVGFVKLLKGQ